MKTIPIPNNVVRTKNMPALSVWCHFEHLETLHNCLWTDLIKLNLLFSFISHVPCHAKACPLANADSEGPDQPAHPHSLIRAFPDHKLNHWIIQNVRRESKGPDDTSCKHVICTICAYHYENMPIQIYWKFYHQKLKVSFSDKNSDIFHISAQNIDCGYSLEPPRRGGSNGYPQSMFLNRNKKNNVYPCKPQFYYINVGFEGVNNI